MLETTELRWFETGPLPASVTAWFTNDGGSGAVEERCDLSLMDRRVNVGIKLRARSLLELKLRRSVTSIAATTDGDDSTATLPGGALEVWQKWSPADELVGSRSEPWVEIRKMIVKRRFVLTGEETAVLDLARTPPGAFCDVEIVAIDDGSTEAWSLAFAANGPLSSREASIETAWRSLLAATAPPPRPWEFEISCGYPEWLVRRAGRAHTR